MGRLLTGKWMLRGKGKIFLPEWSAVIIGVGSERSIGIIFMFRSVKSTAVTWAPATSMYCRNKNNKRVCRTEMLSRPIDPRVTVEIFRLFFSLYGSYFSGSNIARFFPRVRRGVIQSERGNPVQMLTWSVNLEGSGELTMFSFAVPVCFFYQVQDSKGDRQSVLNFRAFMEKTGISANIASTLDGVLQEDVADSWSRRRGHWYLYHHRSRHLRRETKERIVRGDKLPPLPSQTTAPPYWSCYFSTTLKWRAGPSYFPETFMK